MRSRRIILLVILALYVILGVLYAVRTPAWQAPDEPAHYNYVRFVATTGGFPVLQMGDYPHGYMEEIKSRKFPPDLSIDPIRYEFHQPPLYYVLLAPIYAAVRGALLPLRLASVLLGLGVVLLAYAVVRRIYPERAALALGTAAFVAFLPQHLATVSQVGNDVLAELLFAAVLYILVGWVMETVTRDQGAGIRRQESRRQPRGRQCASPSALLLGLILITKTTAYIAMPLAGGVLVWRWWRERASARRIVIDALLIGLPALLLALPWYARDVAVYGWPDFLGLDPPRPDRGRPDAHRRVPGPGRLERLPAPRAGVHLQELLGRFRLARRVHGQPGLFPGGAVEWDRGSEDSYCGLRIA